MRILLSVVWLSQIVPAAVAWGNPPEQTTQLGVPIHLEDPSGHAMDAFHAALRRAASGRGQAHLVFYGASHVASDTFTGPLRQMLQDEFGDAGHGFVLPARPWRSYRHADVNIDGTLTWWGDWVGKRGGRTDGLYGLAGVSIASESPEDYASVATTVDNPHGRRVSRFEIHYLEQPGGGSMDVRIDDRLVRRIATAGLVPAARHVVFRVEDAGHRLEIRPVGDGEVRLFGVVMERDVPGVVLDTLGINGHRAEYQLQWNEAIQREMLALRRPDLVVLAYGTNECGDDDVPIADYEAALEAVVTRIRQAVPQASCLLIGPSDRPMRAGRRWVERPRQAEVVAVQRRVAARHGCAFFDLVAFMGGPLSMVRWVEHDPPMAARDHVHLTARGYRRLAEVLHDALLEGYTPPVDAAAPPPASVTGGRGSPRSP